MYDSNAARTNKLYPTPPGEHKDDFLFPLGLNLDIYVPVGPNVFSLAGYAGYNKAVHNQNLSSENISLTGGYRRVFEPCTFDATGGYVRGRTDYGNTNALTFNKNIEQTARVGGSITCGPDVGVKPFANVDYTSAHNSLPSRTLNDYNTLVYGGGVGLTQAGFGNFGLIGSISDSTYPNRPLSGLFGAHTNNVKNVGFYFKRNTARILQANIQLNYTWVKSNPEVKEFDGLSGSAYLRFMPGGRFIFEGTLARQVTTSLSYNSSYNIETTGQISANAAVSGRLNVSLGYDHTHREYVGVPDIGSHILTDDNNDHVNGSATYTLTPKIGLDFGISYLERSANDPIYNYSAVRVSVGVHVRVL
jgi:hypothetical protein